MTASEFSVDTDAEPADQPTEVLQALYDRHDGVVRQVAEALDAPNGTVHGVLTRRGIHESDPSPHHDLEKLDDLPGLQEARQDDDPGHASAVSAQLNQAEENGNLPDDLRADGSGDCHNCARDATGTDADGRPVCRVCADESADTFGGWS